MEERNVQKSHKIILGNRKTGVISGVKDVISFDISDILLETELGMLHIKGKNLHISRLTLEKGEVELDGQQIESLIYSEPTDIKKQGESFFSRLFK